MNDDLHLLLQVLRNNQLLKIAVKVEHGLNNFPEWEYFNEPEIEKAWNEHLPDDFKGKILSVEEITCIQG